MEEGLQVISIKRKVLPIFEGNNIVGFIYRDDAFKLMSGVS